MSTSFLGLNGTPAEVVGGHPDHFFLGPENGQLSKLVKAQAPEITCYEYLERKGLTRFFPRYFGQRPCGKEGFVFIIMEDLTYSYEHPLPLDTKIGRFIQSSLLKLGFKVTLRMLQIPQN
eukprot:TRINITY_DN7626_c0_g1_i3.p1 TRINITY_DN7626_c0_g1~~TRINITY_DN7626_c0_g1_i3.p1  ORF type:complete len:120 (-),score=7.70 TRINITY_DN7626_c0_g1_i3:761-1120(-)